MKKSFRNFQLKAMGFIAIGIAPITLFFVSVIHGLPFPMSISETATIADKTASLLPFFLGAFALFSLTYSLVYAHDKLDKYLPMAMFVGFTLVAVQPCASPYLTSNRVGIFGVSQAVSGWMHNTGALLGFGALILWISLCFTKSNLKKREQTPEKQLRDKWYLCLSVLMVFSLIFFVLHLFGAFAPTFPLVWFVEAVILTFAGIACLIKGGLFLRDKDVFGNDINVPTGEGVSER